VWGRNLRGKHKCERERNVEISGEIGLLSGEIGLLSGEIGLLSGNGEERQLR